MSDSENWEICKFRSSRGMMIAIYPKNGKFSALNFEFNKPFLDKLGLINTEDNFSSR
ncbi:hypothetical protein H1P_20014 [Hyella patelloides LEGE 07179]|uniref:Uncharacterized protein n=1 Tax=Hyella patelloides LEGE 07179 TaxID=945734 RepID=A0A563VQ71_9CYAN|nr:hypothetical protein H1P_20014 [Hyella patelloides LEGE 07179]